MGGDGGYGQWEEGGVQDNSGFLNDTLVEWTE